MAGIKIDPQEVDGYGSQFKTSSTQVQELLNQVQSKVSILQGGAWAGNRANKFYGDWGTMKPQIVKAIETLNQAGDLLKKAASDFAITDQTK
jgi:WXG100 family type VII secretion target